LTWRAAIGKHFVVAQSNKPSRCRSTVGEPHKRLPGLWRDDKTSELPTRERRLDGRIHRSPQLEVDVPAAVPRRKREGGACDVKRVGMLSRAVMLSGEANVEESSVKRVEG
jgi:hypothetical protein